MAIIVPFSLGIVGHAEDKFTPETSLLAKSAIHSLISKYRPTLLTIPVSDSSPVTIVALETLLM